ncbi:uncharacterized protein F4817DRAFT_83619 [Daldinia loculata]|uniref:uncharacterized protein n=1 Tax=Daldinia loculata TaxID=103429 RepID=UPI0020C2717D|nr:uncharacterized protein F4817DRAFT_83619 [Daldinia loculata]KAI1651853.1 hypothetical protein F4817DRAFT_83619 [Daldinia loculata]
MMAGLSDGLSDASQLPKMTSPKVRSSCDSCGSAKIKCDRSRPRCRRCVTLGIDCIYGISRKLGRVPRRGLSARANSGTTIRTSTQAQRLWPDTNPESSINIAFEEPRQVHETLPSGSNTDVPVSSTYNHDQLVGLHLFNPLDIEQWPQFDFSDVGTRIHGDQNTRGSHSCARESYEIFADLICPAPDLHAPNTNSDTVTARLDQVLHFNRKAIDRLSGLLECSCAKSGHRVMVHASIISRILIWYQQAAGWPCSISSEPSSADMLHTTDAISSSTSSSSGPDEAAGARSPNLRILPRTTGFVVTDVPATLGTFSIEDQKMQASIRNHLVLSELSNMSTLIDLFSSHFSDESSVAGAGSLYTYIAAWLRNEYDKTIRDLRAERIALNDISDT